MNSSAAQRRIVNEMGPQNIEQTRYVFFAGNVIDPNRAREFTDENMQQILKYRVGGIEVDSACLHAIHDWEGFVGRCRITPVLYFGKPWPRQLLAEGERAIELGETVETAARLGANGHAVGAELSLASARGRTLGYRTYPGEHIHHITEGGQNIRRGVVEVTALYREGLEWEEVEERNLQGVFFPDLTTLPKTLREVQERISLVKNSTVDQLVRGIADDMLRSCEMFRLWATDHLNARDQEVRAGRNPLGYSARYSALDLKLMEQLERQQVNEWQSTQSSMSETMAQALGSLAESQKQQAEIQQQLLRMQERQAAAYEAIIAKVGAGASEAAPLEMQQIAVPVEAEEVKTAVPDGGATGEQVIQTRRSRRSPYAEDTPTS